MASYSTNLKNWGATGTEHPDGYNYLEGEQPVDEWDNWLNDNLITDLKDHLIPLTNSRVETDYGASGGEPPSPEASHLYHDQGNERLELWGAAASSWRDLMFRDGDTMTGELVMDNYQISDSSGTVTLDGQVEVPNGGVSIATGQAFKDGGDGKRVEVLSNETKLYGEAGSDWFQAASGGANVIARSGSPAEIYDNEQSATGVQYDTGASMGVLRTPNAGARVEANGKPSTGEGLELRHNVANSQSEIWSYDRTNSIWKSMRFGADLYDFASINAANIRLATGQSIEDESGTGRISFGSSVTDILDENGNIRFRANGGNQTEIRARNGSPITIRDSEGSFDAVQYDTDTSVGELRTPNAFVNVQGSGSPSNAGLHFRYDSGNNWGQVLPRDTNGNNQELFLSGSPVHINSGNLRISGGNVIEGGSGNERVGLFSGGTYIRSQEGAGRPFVQVAGGEIKFDVNSGQNINIRDTGGGFDAVQYLQSDSGSGVLRTLNAGFAVESNGRSASSIGIHFRYDSSNNRGFIQSQDLVNNNAQDLYLQALKGGTLRLRSTSGTIDTTSDGSTPADIRIGTGQAIEDDSGTKRLQFASNLTQIKSESGNRVFRARTDGNGDTRICAYSNSNVDIYDEAGNYTGVQYIASSSTPGTLELTNSTLADSAGNTIAQSVAATGEVTLSSREAVVDTGISTTDATFSLALGVDDPGADAEVSGRLFWDDSAGTYKVRIVEQTSVNPTVNYDVVRVR